jgi:hypothetical protein
VGLEGLPFGVGKISLVAPVHAREGTSPNYPARFSKLFVHALEPFSKRMNLSEKEALSFQRLATKELIAEC